ncbi:MAG: dihydroorotase, partial [Thermodesulfovibrio sp.]|nr:dihydroorotase [Thermodesulfovibrio sp.]
KVLTLAELVRKMSIIPAEILGLKDKGSLRPGADADIVILDTTTEFTVDPAGFASKGKNTPFEGWVLRAAPVVTLAEGRIYRWD